MIETLAWLIGRVFDLLILAIFIRVILSWLPMAGMRVDPYNPVIRLLYQITDPILEPLRRYTTIGMIDLSPFIALIGLQFIKAILIRSLLGG